LLFLLNFSMGIAFTLLESTAETLFLKTIGSKFIPLIMIPTSILRFISGIVYAAYADRIRNDTLYIFLFSFGSTLLAGTWVLIMFINNIPSHGNWVAYGSLFLLYHMLFNLSIMHFSAYANGLFDILESKRLFSLVSTGWRFGGILGGFGLGLALEFVNSTNSLTIIVVFFLLINILLIYVIRWRVRRRQTRGQSGVSMRKLGIIESYSQGLRFIRNSSLLKTGAVAALLMVIFLEVQYFQYNVIFQKEFESEEELARFFLMFAGISNVVGLLLQSIVVPRLIKWVGVGTANLIFPIFSLFTSLSLFFPVFPSATYARFNHKTIKEAIKRPTTFMVYNPVPQEMRGRAQAFIQGFVLPTGVLIASGVLLICQKFNLSFASISSLSLVLGLGYLFMTYRQNQAYVQTLVSILRQKSVDLRSLKQGEFGRVSDRELAPLIQSLQDPDEHIAIFAAEVLGRVGGSRAIKPILEAIPGKQPSIQSSFICVLGRIKDTSIIDPLSEYLSHNDSRVRADTVEALGQQQDTKVVGLIRKLIFDRDNRVSANAVIVLASSGIKQEAELGMSVLEEMLISDSSPMRSSAIYAMGELDSPDAVNRLMTYLQDTSEEVRFHAAAAIQKLVKVPNKKVSAALCLLLDDRSRDVRVKAVETLNGVATKEAIEPLKKKLIDLALKIRRNASEALVKIGKPSFEELLPQLKSISISVPLKEQIVIILRQINLEKSQAELLQLAQRELRTAYANCTLILVLRQAEPPRAVELLIKAVEDKNVEVLSLCLRILESVGDPKTIKMIERGLKYLDKRSRANAIETLEHVGDRKIIRLLIPLLDSVSYEERAEIALQTWKIKKRTLSSVVRHFVGSRDPWLRACALFAIGEMKIMTFGQYVVRNITDKDRYVREAAIESMEKLGLAPDSFKEQDGRLSVQ